MGLSLTLGSVFGTAIRLHGTFLLLLAVIGAVTFAQGGAGFALATLAFFIALFVCVLLHEFGHILAARRYGVRTPDVILLPIGGVARMDRMPEKPVHEIVVALAGPAVNVVIAAVLLVALGGLPNPAVTMGTGGEAFLGRLLYANLLLVAFNMIPAFPMDGGRVLRAALAAWRGYAQGTRIAAAIGQGFAVLLGGAGLLGGNLILALIAAFIFFAAGTEARAARMRQAALGLANADAMMTEFSALHRGSTLGEALESRLRTGQAVLPICEADGKLAGVIAHTSVMEALKQHDCQTPVVQVMTENVPMVGAGGDLDQSARLLQEGNCAAIGVHDPAERLVGLITRETIDDVLRIQEAGHRGSPRGGLGLRTGHRQV